MESKPGKESLERTLVLCKPDAVMRRNCWPVLQRIEMMNFSVVGSAFFKWTRAAVLEFYAPAIMKHPDANLATKYKSYAGLPTLAFIVQGEGCIWRLRTQVGDTDPGIAKPGTLRADYGYGVTQCLSNRKLPIQNVVHASDSKESYLKELDVLIKHKLIPADAIKRYNRLKWLAQYGA